MKENAKKQNTRIIAIILTTLIICQRFYYLIQDWEYCINERVLLLNFIVFPTMVSLILVLVLIGLITQKTSLSIGAFCAFFGVNILYFILDLDNIIFYIQNWKPIISGYSPLNYLFYRFGYLVDFFIAILLLLFLVRKIPIKLSLILVTVLFVLRTIFYSTYAIKLNPGAYIFRLETLFSIAMLLIVLLTMLLHEYNVQTAAAGEKSNEFFTYSEDISKGVSENISNMTFENRSIALYIVLSFITFGIFLLIWLIYLVKDVHKLHGEDKSAVGEVLLMLFIPFYSWYWMYTRGKQMYEDSVRLDGNLNDNSAIYLVLSIFGLNLIAYALIQYEFNKFTIANTRSTQASDFSKNYEPYSAYKSLDELKRMKENRLITEDEYERKKAEILKRM